MKPYFLTLRVVGGSAIIGIGGSVLCQAVTTNLGWEARLGLAAISAAFTITGAFIVPKP